MTDQARVCPERSEGHYYDEWWACCIHNTLIDVDVLAKIRAARDDVIEECAAKIGANCPGPHGPICKAWHEAAELVRSLKGAG